MGLIDGTVTWIAQHTVALLIILIVLGIIGGLIFISEPGRNLVKFLGENPIFIFVIPLVIGGFVAEYLVLMRPANLDENRLNAKQTLNRALREGWLKAYNLRNRHGIETVKHPSRGKFFLHVQRKDAGLQTILLDDFRKTDEPVIWEFGEDLTRIELEKYMKSSAKWEEKVRSWAQADAERKIVEKTIDRDAESKELFGNGTGAKA